MTEIRSYRRVFDLERRVYSVDRLRLNPGGVPVRGIVYFIVLLLLGLVAGALPGMRAVSGALPWYVRDVALPAGAATVLSVIRVEGRTFHLAARALVRHLAAPRTIACLRGRSQVGSRWFPEEIVVLPDGSDARMRRLHYRGPGAVLVAVEHERLPPAGRLSAGLGRASGRRALRLRQLPEGRAMKSGKVILLEPDAHLLVRAHARRAAGG